MPWQELYPLQREPSSVLFSKPLTNILETIPNPSMVAAFGSGAMHSLARGFDPPNEVGSLVATGLLFALVQGGLFKIGEKFSKPHDKDAYNKTRSLLSSLGLQNYEKNFKKGLLTDNTFICSLTELCERFESLLDQGYSFLIASKGRFNFKQLDSF